MNREPVRSVLYIPRMVLVGGLCFLTLQLAFYHFQKVDQEYQFKQLIVPQSVSFYQLLSLGSDRLLSYLMILNLQLHDNQVGSHVSYNRMDYQLLSQWLSTVYSLNPESDYPAFLASRVYSQVKDQQKVRLMIERIIFMFEEKPGQHWRRMTEASLLAKHRLKDLRLALLIAEKISELPENIHVPYWARDMRIILLDELSLHESALLLISSLLESGQIMDPDEKRFLEQKMLKIQQSMSVSEQN